MIYKYVGEEQLGEFHRVVSELIQQGQVLYSPGGAAAFFKVSRQRLHEILQTRDDVRAWAWYEVRRRVWKLGRDEQVLAYMYVSLNDLARYGVKIGKFRTVDDMGMRPLEAQRLLDEVRGVAINSD